MKAVLDTNVFVSGVFFVGPPHEILKAWRDGRIELVVSPEILEGYARVGEKLSERFAGVDLEPTLALLATVAPPIPAPPLPEAVCEDPDDDKFLACAIGAGAKAIISGDRHLLRVSGFRGIEVMKPREFLDRYLRIG